MKSGKKVIGFLYRATISYHPESELKMSGLHLPSTEAILAGTHNLKDWVMIGGFTLVFGADNKPAPAPNDCMIEPVAKELKGYGLSETLLMEMCAQVEHAGEQLRGDCPAGAMPYANVRVHISRRAARSVSSSLPWKYFITRQIASSESDNLDAYEDPRCYIDLHVFQAA
jgi:hypothetical protein